LILSLHKQNVGAMGLVMCC